MDELVEKLRATSPEGLLRTFAALTHQMHDAEDDTDLRTQRAYVELELLHRMARASLRVAVADAQG